MSEFESLHPTITAKLITDVGCVRDHNEDCAYIDGNNRFFIVADGMGGHAAGEVASAMAVDSVRMELERVASQVDAFAMAPSEPGRRTVSSLLEAAVLSAHEKVFLRGQSEPDKEGMGTTLDVLLVAGREAFIAHVGDSRTYVIRENEIEQVTTDHTMAELKHLQGEMTAEEALVSPMKTILVNAIGVGPEVGVEPGHIQLAVGEKLILCSDGLHDYFPDPVELAQIIADNGLDEALQLLVNAAKERGGHDNITAVLLEIVALPAASDQSVNLAPTDEQDAVTDTAMEFAPTSQKTRQTAEMHGKTLEKVQRDVADAETDDMATLEEFPNK